MKSYVDVFSLKGRVAVITGGGTGLGFAMAQCLAGAGAKVVLIGRRQEELDRACKAIGGSAYAYCCDITKYEGLSELVHTLMERFGRIDILVNNAGIQIKKEALSFEEEELERLFAVHLKATYLLTKEVVPYMEQQKGGSVIFLSSETGFIGDVYKRQN